MRAGWIAFTTLAAAAAAAACSAPSPELGFEHYRRTPPNQLGTYERELDVDAADGRAGVRTQNQTGFVIEFTATLTPDGLLWLDNALTELEAGWSPPYPCNECFTMESFRFVVAGDPDDVAFLRYDRGNVPSEAQQLATLVDQLFVQIGSCSGGPYVATCARVQ